MSAAEVASDAPVGVLSASGLADVWPDVPRRMQSEGPLRFPGEPDRIVVGVVSDVRSSHAVSPIPSLYVPLSAKDFRIAMFVVKMRLGASPMLPLRSVRAFFTSGVASAAVNVPSVNDRLQVG